MRAIWTGSISFGLVNIPVKLYSATNQHQIDLDMLDKETLAPIRYARISTDSGKEIPWNEIVKGYKYDGEHYVVITDEDFKKVNVRKTKTIDILDFVREEEIEPIYYEKPYYLEPTKGAGKAYVLLREALRRAGKVGIASFVIRNREHIGVLKPYQKMIVLDQIRFASEIRKPDELDIPQEEEFRGKEVDMALALIDQLTVKFNPEAYRDTYTEEMLKLIEEKSQGKVVRPKGKEPKPSNVADLMSLLQASLKAKEKQKRKAVA